MFKPILIISAILLTIYAIRCQKNKNAVFETETETQIAETISVQEAKTLIENNADNDKFIILDVRSPGEFASGYIKNAVNVDINAPDFKTQMENYDREGIYLVYCRSGNRSRTALNIMIEMDFQTLYNMSGGIIAWQNAGYPVVTE